MVAAGTVGKSQYIAVANRAAEHGEHLIRQQRVSISRPIRA